LPTSALGGVKNASAITLARAFDIAGAASRQYFAVDRTSRQKHCSEGGMARSARIPTQSDETSRRTPGLSSTTVKQSVVMQLSLRQLKINSDTAVRQLQLYACLAVMAILAFATWRRYSNWPGIFDIDLFDETMYLRGGLSHRFNGYEWAPLYKLYYYAVSLISHNAMETYLVGGLLIQLLALYSIGFVAWMLSRSLAIGAIVFSLTLCSPYLLVTPRVSYLAAVFLVLGIWLTSLEPRLPNRLSLTVFISFIISLVRPELLVTTYLAGGILLIVLIGWTVPEIYRARKDWTNVKDRSLYRLAIYLSFSGLLFLTWSLMHPFPIPGNGQRAMMAFGQHYAARWAAAHHSSLNPFSNYEIILGKMFPGADTPTQALFSNPSEWLRYIIENIQGISPAISSIVLAKANMVITLALIIGLFGLLSAAALAMRNRVQCIGLSSILKTVPLVEAGLYVVPLLAALVLVDPEPHEVVLLLAALMPCCAAVGRWHSWSKMTDLYIALVATLVIAAAVPPLPATGQPTLNAIIELRKLNLPIHMMTSVDEEIGTTMLVDGEDWCVYLSPRCTPRSMFLDPLQPIPRLEKREDAILISTNLLTVLRDRGDQSLDRIIKNVNGPAWRRFTIGSGPYFLYYRKTQP
jgi:hypothetical protein